MKLARYNISIFTDCIFSIQTSWGCGKKICLSTSSDEELLGMPGEVNGLARGRLASEGEGVFVRGAKRWLHSLRRVDTLLENG